MSPRTMLQFAIVTLIWGTTWIVIKYQLGDVNPSWSVSYRFLTGGLTLLAWCAVKRLPLTVPRHALPFLFAIGLFQFVLNFNFVYRSELYIPSGIPAVAFALLMVPNALLAWAFLKRPVSRQFLLGATLGIFGVGLLFAQQLSLPGSRAETMLGLTLVIAGVLSASIANVMQASPRALTFPALPGLAWAMLIGAGVNALVAMVFVGPPQFDTAPSYWLGFLYLGVFASALAFALYFDLIRKMGPAEAAWTSVLIPIIAMAISTVAEDFRWTPLAIGGSALALVGLVVALRQPARRPDPQR
ncbi:DMT family transporter [Sandaracinobacter sp. RS1-74]|uniref:DMT family transporter n=1 Tax=Sandaracinobacteroides sayramensis TaxID=2913411 RepID=UPI001EDA4842|nr:DMT family transporter [Sandaracinobacteroides sayramensis]MCG2842157.1 DMT family transporter [Sandaracinobacteroides sayramensis]